jgi:Circularly permutated YpsA SLOG family
MKLLSGGQSGVDRAALDAVIERGIDYGGWCPKDGRAEDFPQPPGLLAKYPKLNATPLADPVQRTEWNVRDAHACLILVDAGGLDASPGTALAQDFAHNYRKPLFVADLANPDISGTQASG